MGVQQALGMGNSNNPAERRTFPLHRQGHLLLVRQVRIRSSSMGRHRPMNNRLPNRSRSILKLIPMSKRPPKRSHSSQHQYNRTRVSYLHNLLNISISQAKVLKQLARHTLRPNHTHLHNHLNLSSHTTKHMEQRRVKANQHKHQTRTNTNPTNLLQALRLEG